MASKALPATCLSNQVRVQNIPVTATILSQGVAQSSGVALVESGQTTYITSNASDIKDLITRLEAIIQQIIVISTSLDATSTSPGTTTAAITALGVLKTQLGVTKDQLK